MEEGCRIYRCAVMGQHPMRFPWGFDEEDDRCQKLKMELAQQIMALRQRGVTQFLTACDCGVGLYAAEIVNGLRETTDQDLMLFCYTPHEEQATKWAPYLRERYFTMLEKCTLISVVCPVGTPDRNALSPAHTAFQAPFIYPLSCEVSHGMYGVIILGIDTAQHRIGHGNGAAHAHIAISLP